MERPKLTSVLVMMAGVGVLLVGVAVVGKQEEVLLDRRIPVRSRPGGVYIYISLEGRRIESSCD